MTGAANEGPDIQPMNIAQRPQEGADDAAPVDMLAALFEARGRVLAGR